MKPEVLTLSDQTPVAAGKTRYIYQHPNNPDWLIKVHRVTSPRPDRSGFLGWLQSLEDRFIYMTGFMRELRPYIYSRYGDHGEVVSHLIPIIGLADTDLGMGLVVGAARDAEGRLAPTLRKVFKRGDMSAERIEKLRQLLAAIELTDLVLGDLNQDNVVLAHDREEGDRFVIIDGLGERTVVPLQEWFGWVNRYTKRRFVRKIERKIQRYEDAE